MTIITTVSEIKTAKTADLVATYNSLTGKSIKKFSDRATGEKQVAKELAKLGTAGDAKLTMSLATGKLKVTRPAAKPVKNADPMTQMADVLNGKAPKLPKKPGSAAKRGAPSKYPLTAKILVVAESNPKRSGTLAYEEFELYKKAKTVGDYVKMGGQLAYLNYDAKRKFIKITEAK